MSDDCGLGLVDEGSASVPMDDRPAQQFQEIEQKVEQKIDPKIDQKIEQKDISFYEPEGNSAGLSVKEDVNNIKKESTDNRSLNSATLVSYHQDANGAETREHDANNILNNTASERPDIDNISKTYSKISGRHLMTIEYEIDEKNVCEDQITADDYPKQSFEKKINHS